MAEALAVGSPFSVSYIFFPVKGVWGVCPYLLQGPKDLVVVTGIYWRKL